MTVYYVSKSAILQAIENAIAQQERRDTEYQAGLELYKREVRDTWFRESQPRWRSLRDYLSKALKNDAPIREEEVKVAMNDRGRYGVTLPDFYNDKIPNGSFSAGGKTYHSDRLASGLTDLYALRDFLNALENDRVTWSALKAIGFEKLEWVFRLGAKLDVMGKK